MNAGGGSSWGGSGQEAPSTSVPLGGRREDRYHSSGLLIVASSHSVLCPMREDSCVTNLMLSLVIQDRREDRCRSLGLVPVALCLLFYGRY